MNKILNFLAIKNELQGANYTIDDLIKIINTCITWIQRIGIALAGISLLVGMVYYAIADVDNKPRAKQRIIQTLFGIIGIVLAVSLISMILSLF